MERSLSGENEFGLGNQNVTAVINDEKRAETEISALIILVL